MSSAIVSIKKAYVSRWIPALICLCSYRSVTKLLFSLLDFFEACPALTAVALALASLAFASRGQWVSAMVPDPQPTWLSEVPAWLLRPCAHVPVEATESRIDDRLMIIDRLMGERLKKKYKQQPRLASVLNDARPLLAFIPGLSVLDMDVVDLKYLAISFVGLVDVVLSLHASLHSFSIWYLVLSSALSSFMALLSAVADTVLEESSVAGIYFRSKWPMGTPPKFTSDSRAIPAGGVSYRVNFFYRRIYSKALKYVACMVDAHHEAWSDEGKNLVSSMPTAAYKREVTDTMKFVRTDSQSEGRARVTAIVCVYHAFCTVMAATVGPLPFARIRVLCTLAIAYSAMSIAWPTFTLSTQLVRVIGAAHALVLEKAHRTMPETVAAQKVRSQQPGTLESHAGASTEAVTVPEQAENLASCASPRTPAPKKRLPFHTEFDADFISGEQTSMSSVSSSASSASSASSEHSMSHTSPNPPKHDPRWEAAIISEHELMNTQELAKGGMGSVYHAEWSAWSGGGQRELVAIKAPHPDLQFVEEFIGEVELLSCCSPNSTILTL